MCGLPVHVGDFTNLTIPTYGEQHGTQDKDVKTTQKVVNILIILPWVRSYSTAIMSVSFL